MSDGNSRTANRTRQADEHAPAAVAHGPSASAGAESPSGSPPVIPYGRQNITEDDIAAVTEVLRSDFLTQGPAVPRFEQAVCAASGASHAVAVNSATSALHIACLALGVGPSDHVWTVPNSFVASANCARYCGAAVDFVDIDPATWNMSVAALAAKLAAAPRPPKVIVPVAFAGRACDLAPMRDLADRYGFAILEDASHAIGGRYADQPIGCGRYADIAVFSFHPVKIVTTAEGGAAATNDAALAGRLRLLRTHGITRDPALMEQTSDGPWYYEQIALGLNYRMTDLQAALGASQMCRLAAFVERRAALSARYDALLAELPVQRPAPDAPASRSARHLYPVVVEASKRRAVFERLRAEGIGVNVHYIPVHLQPYYRRLGFKPGDFPNAEAYYAGALSLPLFPDLTEAQQDRVVASLRRALAA